MFRERHGSWLEVGFIILLGVAASKSVVAEETARPEYVSCSIINLIATPERYDGKRIRTQGVARIEFEGDAVQLSTDDAREWIFVNGVGLKLPSEVGESEEKVRQKYRHLDMRHILVEGVYHAPYRGSRWRGTITDISYFYAPADVKFEGDVDEND